MKKALFIMMVAALLVSFAQAADFKLYPGAKPDEAATREAMQAVAAAKMANVQTAIYTSPDAFAKVAGFYARVGAEYAMPRASGTAGKPKKYEKYDLWEAYFILDGAKDLASSKRWVKVQRPYIGEDVRDVTAIVVTEKK